MLDRTFRMVICGLGGIICRLCKTWGCYPKKGESNGQEMEAEVEPEMKYIYIYTMGLTGPITNKPKGAST